MRASALATRRRSSASRWSATRTGCGRRCARCRSCFPARPRASTCVSSMLRSRGSQTAAVPDRMSDPRRARQAAAIGALVLGLSGVGLAAVVAVQEFPRGLIALGLAALAAAGGGDGVLRRGIARVLGLGGAAFAPGATLLLLIGDRLLEELIVAAALLLGLVCAGGVRGPRPAVTPACAAAAGLVL